MAAESTLPRITKFWIDPNVCLDQRKCVAEAPDLLQDRRESGGPLVVSDAPDTHDKCLQILNAAWVCPVSAFKIQFEDGTVHDGDGDYIRKLCKEHG
jgi:ferredoxin